MSVPSAALADPPNPPSATTVAPADVAPTTTVAAAPAADDVERGGFDVATGSEGVDGLLPGPQIRTDAEQPTLLERFPPAAYTWDGKWAKTEAATQVVETLLADPAMYLLRSWGAIVVRVTGWVFAIPEMASDSIDAFVAPIQRVWWVWALVLFLAAGAYIVYLGLRARTMEALSHIGWVLSLALCAGVFMALPGTLISSANRWTSDATRATLAATSAVDPSYDPQDGTTTRGTFNDPATGAIRQAQDTWWRLFVVTPWATGELGRTGEPIPPGTIDQILAIKSGDPLNLTKEEKDEIEAAKDTTKKPKPFLCQRDSSWLGRAVGDTGATYVTGYDAVMCKRQMAWTKYRDGTLEKIPGVDPWINGKRPLDRAAIGWLALVASIPSGVMLMGLSVAIIFWTYAGVIRLIAFPLYCLAGMSPKGQQAFVEYLGSTVHTFAKRILAAFAMSLLLAGVRVASVQTASRGWAMQCLVQILFAASGMYLWMRHRKSQGKSAVPYAFRHPVRSVTTGIKATSLGLSTVKSLGNGVHQQAGKAWLNRDPLRHMVRSFDKTSAPKPGVDRSRRARPASPAAAAEGTPVAAVRAVGAGSRPVAALSAAPVPRATGPVPDPVRVPVGAGHRPVAAVGAGPRVHEIGETGPRDPYVAEPDGPVRKPRSHRVIDVTWRPGE